MPDNVASYYMKNDGNIWVETVTQVHRLATETEWLEIWKSNPAITLQLCADSGEHLAQIH